MRQKLTLNINITTETQLINFTDGDGICDPEMEMEDYLVFQSFNRLVWTDY